jgi:hypothetical protein
VLKLTVVFEKFQKTNRQIRNAFMCVYFHYEMKLASDVKHLAALQFILLNNADI